MGDKIKVETVETETQDVIINTDGAEEAEVENEDSKYFCIMIVFEEGH